MLFAKEQERIHLSYFHQFRVAWYAMVLVVLRLQNRRKNAFFVMAAAKTHWVQESHALFVVERGIITVPGIRNVYTAKEQENRVMDYHVPGAKESGCFNR